MPKVRVNDIEMHYEDTGEGTPVLLLHGLGSSGKDWESQVLALRKRYRVIVPELRGHGQTDKPKGPYSISLFASDVTTLLAKLDVEPAHVVGFSMGGLVAFQLAVDAPERLRSLVVINSGPAAIAETIGQKSMMLLRQWMLRLLGMRRTAEVVAGRLFPGEGQTVLRRLVAERLGANDKRAYRASFDAIVGWSVVDRLADISLPVCAISSDRDYTSVESKRRYTAQLSNATLEVIEGAGHLVLLERPDELNVKLLEFLRSGEGGAHGDSGESLGAGEMEGVK